MIEEDSFFDAFRLFILNSAPLPDELIKSVWDAGEVMVIPSKTAVGHKRLLNNKLFFINEGCIREYATLNPKEEVTFRFFQGPSFMTVSLFSKMLGADTGMKRVTITPVQGIAWDLDFILKLANSYPDIYRIFCISISKILESLVAQDIDNAQLSSRERYELFLDRFPNIVNHAHLKHISTYLDMRPETLSRVRSEIMNK